MEKIITNSKNLARIKHLGSLNTLEVEFKDGSIYHYFQVPITVHMEAKKAENTSEYMNANIKGKYTYQKVKDKRSDQPAKPETMPKLTSITTPATESDSCELAPLPKDHPRANDKHTLVQPVTTNKAFLALQEEANALARSCNSIAITDETSLALATQTLSKAAGLVKMVEAKRKELKEPYLKAGKEIDAAANSVTGELEEAVENGRGKLKAWNDAKAAAKAEAEEKIRKEWNFIKSMETQVNGKMPSATTPEACQQLIDSINAKWPAAGKFATYGKESEDTKKMFLDALATKKAALQALLSGDATAMEKVKEMAVTSDKMVEQQAETTQVAEAKIEQAVDQASLGATSATRKVWRFEVVDIAQVAPEMLMVNETKVKEAMKAGVADGTIKDGVTVGGIRFYIDNVPVIR